MVWGSERQLLELIRVEGIEHLHAAAAGGRPVIALAPHFIGLNMGGIRVAYEYPAPRASTAARRTRSSSASSSRRARASASPTW
jgi:lauroyl/myristoyl acyltransferase